MPLPEPDALGPLLRGFRRAAALSQEELAERAGVSARAISDLERGQRASAHLDTLRRLADALGLAPEDRGRLIGAAQASRLDVTRSSARPDPLPDRGRPAVRLPTTLTSFVGRGREVEQVIALLRRADVRLVTLTGPGGVGKTRLALRAAAELLDHVPDGAWFVDLTPLADPALVPAAIAVVLGVREAGGQPLVETLAVALRDKQLLLVLDNCEHLLDAAPVVAELLRACPGLTVLATSRAPLRLRGEREVAVPPLGLPATARPAPEEIARSEAVRLFVERARAHEADFALTEANAPAVAGIVRVLDGLPLAIELAASRIKLFPPTALLRRLERRLTLLTGGARDLPARQRTLRDAIAWSHDLLTEEERLLFRRLAVFAGGATCEAAEAVADPAGELGVVNGLAVLVDQSLLRKEDDPDGEPRYRMLETVREYALERLDASGEEAAVRDRHAAWCLALAEAAGAVLWTTYDPGVVARLEAEHPNLRAALTWFAQASDGEALLRIGATLGRFWYVAGHAREGRGWLERALALAPA
ncbi:MAG: helix-turn-helix domain-containing protein, partial [Chloroflexota bacterium]|nr:helix-turn-helix domain-containing protein [Chloroflexota bacterium]